MRSITAATGQRSSHEPLYDLDTRTGDSIEVFHADAVLASSFGARTGWFWWMCRAGLLPDRPPKGPFATSYLAYCNAVSPRFFED